MKHLDKVAIIAALLFTVGCASTSDVENLQAQIDTLKPVVATASADAADAKAAAADAAVKAAGAEAAANRAAQLAQDTNAKLDKLFKKAQFK